MKLAKNLLVQNKIAIEKEMSWGSGGKSVYFRESCRQFSRNCYQRPVASRGLRLTDLIQL